MEDVPAIDERVFDKLRGIMFGVNRFSDKEELRNKVDEEIDNISNILVDNIKPFKDKSIKVSPWVHRDYCDAIFINLEPMISRALFVMQNCSINSLSRQYEKVDKYINSLSLNNEAKLYLKHKIICANSIMAPREPIVYYNDELKIVGPKDDYWVKKDMYDLNNAHKMSISIRVGRYSEKQDVIWFIKRYWDEMTEKMYGTINKDTRIKIEKLWKIPARCMAQCGLDTPSIWNILQERIVDRSELLTNSKNNLTTEDISSEKSRLKDDLEKDMFHTAYTDIWRLAKEQDIKLSTDECFAERKLDLLFDNNSNSFRVTLPTDK